MGHLLRRLRAGGPAAARWGRAGPAFGRGLRPGAAPPHLRAPRGLARSAERPPAAPAVARPGVLRLPGGRPRGRGLLGALQGRRSGPVARTDRRPAPDLLRHDRRRVHAPGRRGTARLAAGAHGARAEPPGDGAGRAPAHPAAVDAGGRLRGVPAHALPGPEALLARGLRRAHPDARRARRGGGRFGRGADRARDAAPRASQRARQPDGQALRGHLPRVRGHRAARGDPGTRRREVPPGLLDRPPDARRGLHPPGPLLQSEPPGVREPGRARGGAGEAGSHGGCRTDALPAGAAPRRRRLRGRGYRDRDAGHGRAPALRHGRHGARHREQPGGVHHLARGRAHLALSDRRGAGRGRAGVPRERRRPRGGRARHPARGGVPAAVQARCLRGPGVLPQARAQRAGRPDLHPAGHVPEGGRAPRGLAALRGAAQERGRPRRRRARGPAGRARDGVPGGPPARPWPAARAALARAGRRLEGVRVGRRGLDGRDGAAARAARAGGALAGRGADRVPSSSQGRGPRGRAREDAGAGPRGLGAGRGARPGHAVARGAPPAPERAGHGARHLQPPPRGAARRRGRPPARPAAAPGRRAGPLRDLRHAARRIGARRLRVRLQHGRPADAGGLGGAVRGFRERGPGLPGPVPGERRVQVAAHVRPDAAAAPRLRRAGPGALERAARALPGALRALQPAGREPHHPGAVVPRAAAPDAPALPQAAGHHEPEEPAAAPLGGLARPGLHGRGTSAP